MRMPLEVFFAFTTNCNLKCKHCYSSSGINGIDCNTKEILKTLKNIRPLRMIISGGDPLIKFQKLLKFLEDYKKMNGNNTHIVIATNGTLVTPERLEKLSPYVGRYQISLDTLDKEKYIKIRGIDLLEKSIEGIINAVKFGVDIQVAFALFKENVSEIPEIIKFCKKNGIKRINVLRQRPLGRSDADLSKTEVRDAYILFRRLGKENSINVSIHDPIANAIGIKSECTAAKDIVSIEVDGKYKPCPLFKKSISGNFKKAWNSDFFNDVRKSVEACKGCKVPLCDGGCKACHWNLKGSPGKDPWCFIGT